MGDFRYLNYYTEYSCKGDLEVEMGNRACFARVMHSDELVNPTIEYNIRVYKEDTILKNGRNNACYFTKKQITDHLNVVKKNIFSFKFKIVEDKEDIQNNRYTIKLKIEEKPLICHKYLLTWLRYLYEFPYNVVLSDVLKLKKIDGFKNISLPNLQILVSSCYDKFYGTGHAFSKTGKFVTFKELKKKLTKGKSKDLNDIHGSKSIFKKITEINSYDNTNYWFDDEIFTNERLPKYIETYGTKEKSRKRRKVNKN